MINDFFGNKDKLFFFLRIFEVTSLKTNAFSPIQSFLYFHLGMVICLLTETKNHLNVMLKDAERATVMQGH